MESPASSPSLALLLKASVDALVVIGPDATVVAWNRTAASMFGCDAAGVIGRSVKQLFAHTSRAEVERLEEAICHGFQDPGLVLELTSAGPHEVLDVAVTPLHDEHGATLGAVLHARRRDARANAGDVDLRRAALRSPATPHTPPDVNRDAERLNLALAAARLGDWSWDARSDMVRLSPRAAEVFDIRLVR